MKVCKGLASQGSDHGAKVLIADYVSLIMRSTFSAQFQQGSFRDVTSAFVVPHPTQKLHLDQSEGRSAMDGQHGFPLLWTDFVDHAIPCEPCSMCRACLS